VKDKNFYKRNTDPGLGPASGSQQTPEHIRGYRIEELVKTGGMSTIYRAIHPETEEVVAIKVLSPKYLKDDEVIQRFLKESEIIAMADHPNIVKLYDQGDWEGGLFIAMEYIDGITLYQHLQNHKLSYRQAIDIALEISYALCHLHTHGVIHRDLKLENILMTGENTIKVIDFGIAQILNEKGASTGKRRRIVGTPIYMSPEQKVNPDSVSYPSDIYSLGIILYELVLGRTNHGKVILSRMPRGLQPILRKCLQPLAANRYSDIVALISDLSDYRNSKEFLADQGI